MLYILLAEGFEEIEALTTLDILRRAGIKTLSVGVSGKLVTGSHNIEVTTDIGLDEIEDCFEGIVLPGGMPGTINLESSEKVQNLIDKAYQDKKLIAAICAAPSILGHKGLLNGIHATCYPGFEKDLIGAITEEKLVVEDGLFITGKGPGATIPFALKIVEKFSSAEKAGSIYKSMQCQ